MRRVKAFKTKLRDAVRCMGDSVPGWDFGFQCRRATRLQGASEEDSRNEAARWWNLVQS